MLAPDPSTHNSSKITALTAAADVPQDPECPYQDEAYFDVIMRVRRRRPVRRLHLSHN